MKIVKEKIASRKIRWLALSIIVLMVIVVFTGNVAHASVFDWFDDTESQTEFLNNPLYQPYLKKFNGDFYGQFGMWIGWGVIKAMFAIVDGIQNMIPGVLDLFSFVESTGLNKVYQSVLNTVVIGLMVLSLVIIGYKMVTGKGTVDLKSVGMNVVMSIALILLMPTLIHSGIEFSKTFYNDTTAITNSDEGVAWSLIEQGVTDLAYINKTDQYPRIDKTNDRNNLTKKNFWKTDLTQVLTDNVLKKMEKENATADNLRYELVENSDNGFVATKFDDNFLSTFSDGLKSGYYRYQANLWGISIGLIALAIAYIFSAFVIITAILELAFKRVLGILVFATDLETGQRSKLVLSDIFQCYLTVGFQGFGLSMFAMFINFLNAGEGISTNIFIKTIAYICAVIVLIKGSGTVMRYFGVDIGLKEGYGQLASAFGMGAMLFRKGAGGMNRAKGGKNNGGSDQGEGEDRKLERNFGQSLSQQASKTGKALGYARERGLSGLASDGLSKATDTATKPLKGVRGVAEGIGKGFKEGLDDGTVSAIKKNSKPISASDNENDKGRYDTSVPTRLSQRKDGAKTPDTDRVISSSERMKQNASNMQQVQSQMQQDLKQRIIKASEGDTNKAREEFIQQKRQKAKYTPESLSREEMIKQRTEGRRNDNTGLKDMQVRENLSNSGLNSTKSVDVRENLQNTTSSQGGNKTIDVRENVQSSEVSQPRTVDVRENLQNTTSSQGGNKTIDVRENVQSSEVSQPRTVDVRENLQNTTSSQGGNKTIDVRENVQSSGVSQPRTVDVHETRTESKQGDKTQKVNIIEERKEMPNEKVVVEQEVREKKRPRFTYENNPLFQDISDKPNPLFDSLFKK
ncbi:pLS20_p028 family conjugation system transmembrane protein [Enterococcus faecalis]|uniref:pLS20_p028 family conjugation system transmembrane protein n=1 Tax=Enterococcus faecalis TaxID=1351 RepID=UPI003B674DC2